MLEMILTVAGLIGSLFLVAWLWYHLCSWVERRFDDPVSSNHEAG